MPVLTDQEFSLFQRFIFEAAGITLADSKSVLVSSRLLSRVQECGAQSFGAYFQLLASGGAPEEVQIAIDLLTTNETYFFREQRHFDFLRERLEQPAFRARASAMRVWSAAGSSGEEAYSIAMLLEDCLRGRPWEVVASDISARVLERARAGKYPMERARNIPLAYLRRFCLEGQGKLEHTLLVERSLRHRVHFLQVNLNAPLPELGTFDVVFLRNVLIYFNLDTKRDVVERVIATLRPGGWLFVGHAESLYNITNQVTAVTPAIYQKP